MQELKLLKKIVSELERNQRVCLIVVCDHSHGSPGKQGFKMVISEGGQTYGTIGGGIMEFELLKLARERFSLGNQEYSVLIPKFHNLSAKKEWQSGLICAGYQKNILTTLIPKQIGDIKKAIYHLENHENAYLYISPAGCFFKEHMSMASEYEWNEYSPHDFEFKQSLAVKPHIYIVGSGHVGLALTKVLQPLSFKTTVFDHRSDISQVKQNIFANRLIVDSYCNISRYLLQDTWRCACVVSTSFHTDVEALNAILGFKWNFIGLMGSRAKFQAIKVSLRDKGLLEEDINRIKSPIGLPINSQTPEEIAISIAAELIRIWRMERGVENGAREWRMEHGVKASVENGARSKSSGEWSTE